MTCCGTDAEAQASGGCCGSAAKEQAISSGAACCG
jgi:lactoylglutathione lyase